ncbi:MAG: NUDIX domain-containing protein [Aeromicrobium sp.]
MVVPKLVVGALIVDSLEKPSIVLAARRTGPPVLAGRWEFPGGKVETGELAKHALVRELREELSIEVKMGQELVAPGGGHWSISDQVVMRLWFVVIEQGVPKPEDSHDAVAWLDADSLGSVDWLDADRSVLPFVFANR